MTRRERRLQRIRQSPADVRFDQLAALLTDFGFERRQGKGDHVLFKHPDTHARLSVPNPGHGRVLPVYVRKALKLVEEHHGQD